MTARKVIRMGHPTLRKLAAPVTLEEIKSPEFKTLLPGLMMPDDGSMMQNIGRMVRKLEFTMRKPEVMMRKPELIIRHPVINKL